jgi:starch-binding outer membrane protein, SusD/RagB family
MKNILNFRKASALLMLGCSMFLGSCLKDLDREPFIEVTSASVYKDPANYKAVLAKLYAGLAVSGQQGPAGKPDISGIDEGFSTYLRQYWKAQELTTDEAVIAWLDGSLPDYHEMDWSSGNEFVAAMYNRMFYQITQCNEFIRESTPAKLAERGIGGTDATDIATYGTEARFLRALSYWHALDMFGNVPFVTERDLVGSNLPNQTTRNELFNYIEKELQEIIELLPAAGTNEYGRADRAAAATLLGKLYLNAEIYIGQEKYTQCVECCKAVIESNVYSLDGQYRNTFLCDNDNSPEVIFPIRFDGLQTQTWGGMTFLVHAPIGGSMVASEFGVDGGWGGLRTTSRFVDYFVDTTGTTDTRAMFHFDGQTREIQEIKTFDFGYPITKYRNVDQQGNQGSDATGKFPDNDFPMFRLADVYLMAAEAVARGGVGYSAPQALEMMNMVVRRAHSASTDYDIANLTLDNIFNERTRELYWEGHRRTDLIRYGKFTGGSYLWDWKGNVLEGQSVSDHLNLFPIPAADLIANPKLQQNPGY